MRKTKIKHFLKVEEQKQGLELGCRLLERELRRHPPASVPSLESDQWARMAGERGYESMDEMTRMVGYGRVSAGQVVNWMMSPGEGVASYKRRGRRRGANDSDTPGLRQSREGDGGQGSPDAALKMLQPGAGRSHPGIHHAWARADNPFRGAVRILRPWTMKMTAWWMWNGMEV